MLSSPLFFWLSILGAMGEGGKRDPRSSVYSPTLLRGEEMPSSTHTHVGPRAHSPVFQVVVGGGLALI